MLSRLLKRELLPQLKTLVIRHRNPPDDGRFTGPALGLAFRGCPRLEELDLAHFKSENYSNREDEFRDSALLTTSMLDALTAGCCPHLRRLNAKQMVATDPEARLACARFLRSGACPQLKELNLYSAFRVGPLDVGWKTGDDPLLLALAGRQGVLGNGTLKQLEVLRVGGSSCPLSKETAVSLVESLALGQCPCLTGLELGSDFESDLGAYGAVAAALQTGAFRNLKYLSLQTVNEHPTSVFVLLSKNSLSAACPNLKLLNLISFRNKYNVPTVFVDNL